jgi:hypothetical protein
MMTHLEAIERSITPWIASVDEEITNCRRNVKTRSAAHQWLVDKLEHPLEIAPAKPTGRPDLNSSNAPPFREIEIAGIGALHN